MEELKTVLEVTEISSEEYDVTRNEDDDNACIFYEPPHIRMYSLRRRHKS